MPGSLDRLEVTDFRCLREISFEPAAGINLITGANASGKTSLLEAIFILGRGRSFRTAQRTRLIRDQQPAFTVAGLVSRGERQLRMGVRGERNLPLQARIDGRPADSLAELSEWLPVEAIDPEIHKLVDEGPERRRRFVDWGTFHVEQRFLPTWGRYRKALRQRNVLLQSGRPSDELGAWERELVESGEALTAMRQTFLAAVEEPLRRYSLQLTDLAATIRFRPGWDASTGLDQALRVHRDRDLAAGRTLAGPHRAELVLELGDSRARARVSRGQQKLLAASLILAQLEVLEQSGLRRPLLLLDDPSAELDSQRVARLLAAVQQVNSQLFVTALHRNNLPDFADRRFHMEQFAPRLVI